MTTVFSTPVSSVEPAKRADACPLTLFIHVPKTAGTTFNSLLSYQYGHRRSLWVPWQDTRVEHNLMQLDPAERDRLTLIRGHFPFGWHEHFDRPVRYISMLRHPVDRILSLFYYLRHEPDCADARAARSAKSVEEFVVRRETPHVDNDQVRLLSGCTGSPDAQAVETAKQHLHHDFCCVGITERFEETVVMMAQRLGWRKPVFFVSSKRNRRRPRIDDLSSHARRVIERHNEHDLALYEYAARRFDAACREPDQNFNLAMARLRRRNRLARVALPLPLWFLRTLRKPFMATRG